jgi:hypothetical protein
LEGGNSGGRRHFLAGYRATIMNVWDQMDAIELSVYSPDLTARLLWELIR